MSFDSLGLSAELLKAVHEEGYSEPTPIQQEAIPAILAGRDVMGGAQTGTGKTAGFTLPLLQRLMGPAAEGQAASLRHNPSARRHIRSLILTPTRELAAQVEQSVRTYGRHLPLRTAVIFGGVGMGAQISRLRAGVDIVVATPGRLLDHAEQRTIDLSRVEILVLDEADRMLDMGFLPDIRRVLSLLPRERQNLLFSATTSDEIRGLAEGFMRSPAHIHVAPKNTAAELVEQIVHPVDRERKAELLSHLIQLGDWRQVLIFTRTKHGADRLARRLERDGIEADAIHGDKAQNARTRALADFKRGRVRALVATDIAARGLDIDQLPHVVNYELPHVPEDYVHRIGRTGRAGSEGQAVSLVCVDERSLLRGIEQLLGRDLERFVIEGFEPDPRIRPEPILRGRQGGRPQGRPQFGGRSEGRAEGRRPEERRSPRPYGQAPARTGGYGDSPSRRDERGASRNTSSGRSGGYGGDGPGRRGFGDGPSRGDERGGAPSRSGGYGAGPSRRDDRGSAPHARDSRDPRDARGRKPVGSRRGPSAPRY